MKMIYRSVTKFRRKGSFYSWISVTSIKATSIFIQFTKTAGIASLIKFIISFLFVVLFIPVIGLLFILSSVYKYTVQKLCDKLYPEEKLQVIWNTSLRGVFDSYNDYGVVTVLALANGYPDIVKIKRRVSELVETTQRFDCSRHLLTMKFGCYAWRKRDTNFKIDNQVILLPRKWNGKPFSEDVLQSYLSELHSHGLPKRYPPWQVLVIPLAKIIPTYALVIRMHHILANNITLNDIFDKSSSSVSLKTDPLPQTFQQQLTSALVTLKNIVAYLIEIPNVLLKEITNTKFIINNRRISKNKSISWTENLSVEFVNKLAKKSCVTFNDILLCGISGAFRRYYSVMEGFVPDYISSIMVPLIDFNNIKIRGIFPFYLPLTTVDLKSRLLQLKSQSTAMEEKPSNARVMGVVLNYLDRLLPDVITKFFLKVISQKYSVIINNCHLSSFAEEILQDDVKMVHCWRPLIGHVGVSLTLMHTKGSVGVAAITDPSSIQRPDILLEYFIRELNDLAVDLKVRAERRYSPISERTI